MPYSTNVTFLAAWHLSLLRLEEKLSASLRFSQDALVMSEWHQRLMFTTDIIDKRQRYTAALLGIKL